MIRIDFTNKDIVTDNLSLYQWDYGQKLEIAGTGITQDTQIHFAREGQQAEIRIGTYVGNALVVDIPDILLQSAGKFKAYIYLTDDVSGQTIKVANFNVRAREKPTDYTADPYIDIVAELNAKLNKIIETGIAQYEPDPILVENLVNERLALLGTLSEKDEVAKADLSSALALEIDNKLNTNKIVTNLAVTENGFVPDAKTVSDNFNMINNNLVNITSGSIPLNSTYFSSGTITYNVKAGVCYVDIGGVCTTGWSDDTIISTTSLPIPKNTNAGFIVVNSSGVSRYAIVDSYGNLYMNNGVITTYLRGSCAYAIS